MHKLAPHLAKNTKTATNPRQEPHRRLSAFAEEVRDIWENGTGQRWRIVTFAKT